MAESVPPGALEKPRWPHTGNRSPMRSAAIEIGRTVEQHRLSCRSVERPLTGQGTGELAGHCPIADHLTSVTRLTSSRAHG